MNYTPFVFSHNLLYTPMSAQSFYIVTYRDSFHGFRSITFNSLHNAVTFSEQLLSEGCNYVMIEHTFRKVVRIVENGNILVSQLPY